jgi:uncharacterized membrane protein YhaH (DUF805 family)
MTISRLIFLAGIGQLSTLIASALVPVRLNWRREFSVLPRLHRQMYWVYGGYIAMTIATFGVLSILTAEDLASGTPLARGLCAYIAVFWGVRLCLQSVLDTAEYLTRWWLRAGYLLLTVMFAAFTVIYTWAAVHTSGI